MILYRALRNLEKGGRIIEKGAVFAADELGERTVGILERMGKVARASVPPLEALPGWSERAKKLAEFGVIDAEEFLSLEDGELAKALDAPEARIADWKNQLLECLQSPKREG